MPPSTFAFVGSQAFQQASAFNANIGAWNTASVSCMSGVRAAFGPATCNAADALGWLREIYIWDVLF